MSLMQRDVLTLLQRTLANDAKERVRRFTPSRTLRDALRVVRDGHKWFIGVPHYWAVYYHDGRAAATSTRTGGFLVWYKNPKDDPRHNGNFPTRASQLRSLPQVLGNGSLEQLRADIESGKAVISRSSPRSGGSVAGKPFFVRGLRNYFDIVGNRRTQKVFRDHVKVEVPLAFKKTVVKQTWKF